DIHFIDKHMPRDAEQVTQPSTRHVALAGALMHAHAAMQLAQRHGLQRDQLNWRSSNTVAVPGKLGRGEHEWNLRLDTGPDGRYVVSVDDADAVTFVIRQITATTCRYICDDVQATADYIIEDDRLWLAADGHSWAFEDRLL